MSKRQKGDEGRNEQKGCIWGDGFIKEVEKGYKIEGIIKPVGRPKKDEKEIN